jgi:hypothetical protein
MSAMNTIGPRFLSNSLAILTMLGALILLTVISPPDNIISNSVMTTVEDTYHIIKVLDQVKLDTVMFGGTGKIVYSMDDGVYIRDITTLDEEKISGDCVHTKLWDANDGGDVLYSCYINQGNYLIFRSRWGGFKYIPSNTEFAQMNDYGYIAYVSENLSSNLEDLFLYRVNYSDNFEIRMGVSIESHSLKINSQHDITWAEMANAIHTRYYFYDADSQTTILVGNGMLVSRENDLWLNPQLSDRLTWLVQSGPYLSWFEELGSRDYLHYTRLPDLVNLVESNFPMCQTLTSPGYSQDCFSITMNSLGDIVFLRDPFRVEEGVPEEGYRLDIYVYSRNAHIAALVDSSGDPTGLGFGSISINDFGLFRSVPSNVVYEVRNQNGREIRAFQDASRSILVTADPEMQLKEIANNSKDILLVKEYGSYPEIVYDVYVALMRFSPVANAGSDRYAQINNSVTLDSSLSSDLDNPPAELTYRWAQIGGTSVNLIGDDTVYPSFVAPPRPETLVFQVTVTDPDNHSSTDEVRIFIWDSSDPNGDADGDGISNQWESEGRDIDGDGVIDLDLPAMGADPLHKDIFVEVDYEGMPGYTQELYPDTLFWLIWAFKDAPVPNPDMVTGIKLHIDAGPGTLMDPADDFGPGENSSNGQQWGDLSRSNVTPQFISGFGYNTYTEIALQDTRNSNMPLEREGIFHYAILVYYIASLENWAGGYAWGNDFVLENSNSSTVSNQAAAFLHELGHTLGLGHGGGDNTNYKPNYLSVMNYEFSSNGLSTNQSGCETIDFSSTNLLTLNENSLDERLGIVNPPETDCYTTEWQCPDGSARGGDLYFPWKDWNCSRSIENNVSSDINGDGSIGLLSGFDDWEYLTLKGCLTNCWAP